MKSSAERVEEVRKAAEMANSFLRTGKDTLLLTSRELVKGKCNSYIIVLFLSLSAYFQAYASLANFSWFCSLNDFKLFS